MRNSRGRIPVYSCSGSNAIIRSLSRSDALTGVEAGDFHGIYSGRGQMEEELEEFRCDSRSVQLNL
jgi:hypothetical protein